MSAVPDRAIQPAGLPTGEPQDAALRRSGAVLPTAEEAEYNAVFGAFGILQQAKEGFIASRFSPTQPLRMRRSSNARREQPMPHTEISGVFCYIMPFENPLAA